MTPTLTYRVTRRLIQAVLLTTLLVAPLLGGWQRLDRNDLAGWDGRGWDLPAPLLERLPGGSTARAVYEATDVVGGGTSASAWGVAAADPVGGLVAVLTGTPSWLLLFAWGLPLLLSVVAGRFFCGWMCPFGVLARFGEWLLERMPWRPRPLRLPERRPLRWVVLGGTVVAAFLGFQILLYALLPYAVLQASAYQFWLMGGGGAALGWLLALVVAGFIFGPTTYCAAVCPTGAALSLGGHARLLRVRIEDPELCGKRCNLCTRACWLQLDPASGDPGADCDLCTRCFPICPRDNLRVGRIVTPLLLMFALLPTPADATARHAPKLLVDEVVTQNGVDVAISVVDYGEVRLDADDPRPERGVQVTVQILRGEEGPTDPRGKQSPREFYIGPMDLRVGDFTHHFEHPNSPRSTPRRRLYRIQPEVPIGPGDPLTVATPGGWLDHQVVLWIPRPSPGVGWNRPLWAFAVGMLVFSGLLLIAGRGATHLSAAPDGSTAGPRRSPRRSALRATPPDGRRRGSPPGPPARSPPRRA